MFRNYLLIALRNLTKRKGHSLLNIFGLSLGITAAFVIFLYVRFELSYDRFHQNADDIFLVYKERITPTGVQTSYDTWAPFLDRLKAYFPEIRSGSRYFEDPAWVTIGNRRFREQAAYADSSFLDVFTFPPAAGRGNLDRNSVFISEALAGKYFGEQFPEGKTIRIGSDLELTVAGVLKPIPGNSSMHFDLLLRMENLPGYENLREAWNQSFLSTYIRLKDRSEADALAAKFPDFIDQHFSENEADRLNLKLLALPEMYNELNHNSRYAYLLLWVAVGILLIASINFMNLATARSMERAREVGMRKVLGARRNHLATQFLGESLVLTFLALVIGFFGAEVLLPYVNTWFDIRLGYGAGNYGFHLALVSAMGVVLALFSGSYPAFFLSGFKPLEALSGRFAHHLSGRNLRAGLVVLQFGISILLIIGSLTVWRQLRFMINADMTFQPGNTVVLPVALNDFESQEEANIRLETFREEISRLPGVNGITSSTHIPSNWDDWFTFARPADWEGDPLRLRQCFTDADYFRTFGIQLKEGRAFEHQSNRDSLESVIINESAMKAFGWTSIKDKVLVKGSRRFNVIGLAADYNFQSLQNEVEPVLHFYRSPGNSIHSFISLDIREKDADAVLSGITRQWEILDPGRPFEYFFLDESVHRLYQSESRLLAMITSFSFLAILIACLGLFGLAAFSAARRTKEIGVRKVLGASVSGIVGLLSKDFLKLVLIALLAAAPLAWIVMDNWLGNFAYRINNGWTTFLVTAAGAGLLAMVIAFLTIGLQAVKAALANPVESLRNE
ncbi:MAG TPA: ABC transporter permease [Flavilitoribacter sp.]|nr:ABC transporter permease [Flavilitoribacter sp.]HMQ87816.1 ABC transporter permease [Flavilitoribacter sp.]